MSRFVDIEQLKSSADTATTSSSALHAAGHAMTVVVDVSAAGSSGMETFLAWRSDETKLLDRFDVRHFFDDARVFNDIQSSSVRSEPNFALRRTALESLHEARYNDFALLLEQRASEAQKARDAEEKLQIAAGAVLCAACNE
jgi:hypothetical protein